jgi:hypothetical protein
MSENITATPARAIMTRAELATHQADQYGRNYSESCDGYEDMEAEGKRGWTALASWGRDGWNLGDWPYVAMYVRTVNTGAMSCKTCGANLTDGSGDGTNGHWQNCTTPYSHGKLTREYQLMQIVEGDRTAWAFGSEEDLSAALDYLFLWYAAGEDWAPLSYDDRAALDAGELTVDSKFRGGYRTS